MKKPIIVLICLIIFSLFAFFGFESAKKAWQTVSEQPPKQFPTDSPKSNSVQHNILIIRVNDLASPSPAIKSAWILFFTTTDPSNLILKILYPSAVALINPDALILDKQSRPTVEFENEIKKINISWDGYLIFDETGMKAIGEWFGGVSPETSPDIPQVTAEAFNTYQADFNYFIVMCKNLPDVAEHKTNFRWRSLIPAHIRSDLSFENLVVYWDFMTSTRQPICKVMPWN
jgi:hypothetical protein